MWFMLSEKIQNFQKHSSKWLFLSHRQWVWSVAKKKKDIFSVVSHSSLVHNWCINSGHVGGFFFGCLFVFVLFFHVGKAKKDFLPEWWCDLAVLDAAALTNHVDVFLNHNRKSKHSLKISNENGSMIQHGVETKWCQLPKIHLSYPSMKINYIKHFSSHYL